MPQPTTPRPHLRRPTPRSHPHRPIRHLTPNASGFGVFGVFGVFADVSGPDACGLVFADVSGFVFVIGPNATGFVFAFGASNSDTRVFGVFVFDPGILALILILALAANNPPTTPRPHLRRPTLRRPTPRSHPHRPIRHLTPNAFGFGVFGVFASSLVFATGFGAIVIASSSDAFGFNAAGPVFATFGSDATGFVFAFGTSGFDTRVFGVFVFAFGPDASDFPVVAAPTSPNSSPQPTPSPPQPHPHPQKTPNSSPQPTPRTLQPHPHLRQPTLRRPTPRYAPSSAQRVELSRQVAPTAGLQNRT